MSIHDEQAEQARAKLAQQVAAGLAQQRENWPMMLEIYAHQATERKARYLAHLKAGFTDEQAMRLCTVA